MQENVCIYCRLLKTYFPLKGDKYPKLHEDIYNTRKSIIQFINKYSSKDIKPYPLTKLITYEDYVNKYK